MPGECPEWCANGRFQRTRSAYSRRRHDVAHRSSGSTRNRIGVPYPVHGRLDYSDSWSPSLEVYAELTDRISKPLSPAGRDTRERAFVAASELIKKNSHPRAAFLESEGTYLYDKRTLPFLVFDELDRKLFCSKLRGNVCLRWENVPWGIPGRAYQAGRKYPRITIELSEKMLLNASKTGILTALLHQMIHAYFLQCCGYRTKDSGSTGYDLGHGLEFQALKNVIIQYLRRTFSGRKPSHLYSWNPLQNSRLLGRAQEPYIYAESNTGCSNCYRGDLPLSRKQNETLKLWMTRVVQSSAVYSAGKGDKSLESSDTSSKGYWYPSIRLSIRQRR